MASQAADFDGTILIVAPHMDDESLGCGALLASRLDKSRLHVVFATDGAHSPARSDQTDAEARELARLRQCEALEALEVLGIPAGNAGFLGFEDGTLARYGPMLQAAIVGQVRQRRPAFVFVPFRYDRHPDHLAVNRAASAALRAGRMDARIVEYFVYSRWRLLRTGDIRDYVEPAAVRRIDPAVVKDVKRRAIECHRSQTRLHYPWQTRPILARELIERVCIEPETYLVHDLACEGPRVLTRGRGWVPIAHWAEPRLKRWKDRLGGWKGA